MLFHDAFFEVFGEVGADALFGAFHGHFLHVVVDHEVDELLECGFLGRIPSEASLGFGGVSPEVDHIGGAVEVGADFDESLACGLVDALLVLAFAFPAQLDACAAECKLAEFPHGVLLAGGDHEVFGLLLLKQEPHALHVVFGVAPVAERAEVSEVELLLLALGDAGGCK